MRALGISFSGREDGNCGRCVRYCLDRIASGEENSASVWHIREHPIHSCGDSGYICFSGAECPIQDGMDELAARCCQADVILWALPAYRGRLPTAYFAFSERLEGFVQKGADIAQDIFSKVHIILVGNHNAGAETALSEALSDFNDRDISPETVVLASREYHRRSIDGDLIEIEPVRQRLDRFVHAVLGKSI